MTLLAIGGLLLGTFGAAGPAEADASKTVAIRELQWSHGSDILNARMGIERTSDLTQGRFRLHLRCFWIDQDTGRLTGQLCNFHVHDGETCWYDDTVGFTTSNPVCRQLGTVFDDADYTWVGVYRSFVPGHTYHVFITRFWVFFHNDDYVSQEHAISSYYFTY